VSHRLFQADKRDMGHFRFSDIDRNLLVASTDMPDMTKKSLRIEAERTKRLRPHYSETEHASDVFGERGVYIDSQAIDQPIRLDLVNENS
jgi:hypothetical protein